MLSTGCRHTVLLFENIDKSPSFLLTSQGVLNSASSLTFGLFRGDLAVMWFLAQNKVTESPFEASQ